MSGPRVVARHASKLLVAHSIPLLLGEASQVRRARGYIVGRRIGSEFFTNIICSGSGQVRLNCRRRPSLAAISKHLNESLAHARLPRKFCSRYELKDLSHIASPPILTRVEIFLLHLIHIVQQTRFYLFEE